mmetsp:Transcript_32426/g.39245  ORF Transcript_32426/g.39245 Transcript_32426/m.39245 type:complete len:97 (-) Transcript_32426:281-571(-)|eukprot:CAMPEP_0197851362 /NCGR_PEP_ID=MMETSP1438-20131217/17883_1 /TAXON_ID=1461541 /ORGANISM="Pterosperma sp., Strain CCMP1384" /LENGTH=96 /DNA_ID=CAMNT_0043464939 /DNA_START=79 /DNA_END=369 /DNA_ORIENTATION=+
MSSFTIAQIMSTKLKDVGPVIGKLLGKEGRTAIGAELKQKYVAEYLSGKDHGGHPMFFYHGIGALFCMNYALVYKKECEHWRHEAAEMMAIDVPHH